MPVIFVPSRQSAGYTLMDDTTKAAANGENGFIGTDAAILAGVNGSSSTDYNGRKLTKTINTGWAPAQAGPRQ
jgi:hypothetical protein